MNENSKRLRALVYAAVCLALCMILPILTGHIPQIGKMLSPMHIPVYLCGFLVGWPWAVAVGFIAPLLRGALFSYPALVPGGISMAFELATYGFVSGFLYPILLKRFKRAAAVYAVLIIAMVCGRIVWGILRFIIGTISSAGFTMEQFIAGALTQAIPGIILHLILIPVLVLTLENAGVSLRK